LLIVDETAEGNAVECSAGAGCQYSGRLSKLDLCQVPGSASIFAPPSRPTLTGPATHSEEVKFQ
jgi:hypothetical protein